MEKQVKSAEIKYEGYCMKCKSKRVMKDITLMRMKKTNAPCVKGMCVKCGTKMFKILPKQ
jgi:hypothetical protein